jgi:hypothetical protein
MVRALLDEVSVLPRRSRLWVGVALMALPPLIACATCAAGQIPDGGFSQTDGGGADEKGGADSSMPDTSSDEGGCSSGAQCCTPSQCPPTAHVQTTACTGGSCAISTCSPGWYEYDASYASGCNCHGSDNPTSCGTAMAVPPLTDGMSTTLSGNLPTESSENWFQITFAGDALEKTYHPEIKFTTNPSNEFVFDVASDCGGDNLSCADRDAAVGVTTWEEFWGSKDAGTGPDTGVFKPIPPVGAAGVVLVRVHRANPGANCDGYVLSVSD